MQHVDSDSKGIQLCRRKRASTRVLVTSVSDQSASLEYLTAAPAAGLPCRLIARLPAQGDFLFRTHLERVTGKGIALLFVGSASSSTSLLFIYIRPAVVSASPLPRARPLLGRWRPGRAHVRARSAFSAQLPKLSDCGCSLLHQLAAVRSLVSPSISQSSRARQKLPM